MNADPIQFDEECFYYTNEYRAYRDPEGLYGYGKTKDEAVNDLLEQESEQ